MVSAQPDWNNYGIESVGNDAPHLPMEVVFLNSIPYVGHYDLKSRSTQGLEASGIVHVARSDIHELAREP